MSNSHTENWNETNKNKIENFHLLQPKSSNKKNLKHIYMKPMVKTATIIIIHAFLL